MRIIKKVLINSLLFLSIANANLLDDILKKAESSDYKLKSLIAEEKAKEYVIKQNKSKYKPQITFSSYIGWQQFKPYYGSQKEQFLQFYYLSMKQPIYKPQILSQIKISKLEKKLAKIKVEQEKQYIKYYTLNLLLDYVYYKDKLNTIIELKNLQKEKLTLLNKLHLKKLIDSQTLLDAEETYLNTRIQYKEALIDYRNIKKALNLITDENLEPILYLSLNKNVDLSIFEEDYYFWEKNLDKNFEIKYAKVNVEIAEEEIKNRKLVNHPNIDLELSYRYSSTSAVSIASDDKRVALIIDLPIYQGGFANSYLLEAKQLKISAQMQLKDTKRNNLFLLKDYWFEMYKSKNDISNIKKQINIRNEKLEFIKKGYERKIKTKIDVVNQQISLLNAKLNLIEKLHSFSVSYIKLLYLTGQINKESINKVKSLFDL